jgi:hypothetical protein
MPDQASFNPKRPNSQNVYNIYLQAPGMSYAFKFSTANLARLVEEAKDTPKDEEDRM